MCFANFCDLFTIIFHSYFISIRTMASLFQKHRSKTKEYVESRGIHRWNSYSENDYYDELKLFGRGLATVAKPTMLTFVDTCFEWPPLFSSQNHEWIYWLNSWQQMSFYITCTRIRECDGRLRCRKFEWFMACYSHCILKYSSMRADIPMHADDMGIFRILCMTYDAPHHFLGGPSRAGGLAVTTRRRGWRGCDWRPSWLWWTCTCVYRASTRKWRHGWGTYQICCRLVHLENWM